MSWQGEARTTPLPSYPTTFERQLPRMSRSDWVARSALTALYVAVGALGMFEPWISASNNVEYSGFPELGQWIKLAPHVMFWTFIPATLLLAIAVLSALDSAASRKRRSFGIGPVLGVLCSLLPLFFLLLSISIARSPDPSEVDWTGNQELPSTAAQAWLWLAYAFVVPVFAYFAFAFYSHARAYANPSYQPSYWRHFLVGAIPTLGVAGVALAVFVADRRYLASL